MMWPIYTERIPQERTADPFLEKMKGNEKMKKVFALILACVLLLSCMAACSSKAEADANVNAPADQPTASEETTGNQETEDPVSEPVTITLWILAENMDKPHIKKPIDMWQEATGNKIDVIGLPDQDETPLAKFATGDIPDVLIVKSGASLLNYNPEENFVDFTNAEWISELPKSTSSAAYINGKLYGLPNGEASTSGCIYNKKIFEELGISVPTNQAEFNAVCDTLLENGIQPIYMPAGDAWATFQQFAMDPIFDAHPEYFDQLNSGEMTYADIPEMKNMCEWFKEAADKGYFGSTYASDKWEYISEVIGTGEVAMVFCWDTWLQTDYDNESYVYKNSDFGLMPVFMGTRDEGTFEGGNFALAMVNKNSERRDAAVDLINFMAKPEVYNAAYEGIATAPIYTNMTTNVDSEQYLENKDTIDRLKCASATPAIVGFNSVQHGQCLVRLMLGEINADECIAAMDEERIATLNAFGK